MVCLFIRFICHLFQKRLRFWALQVKTSMLTALGKLQKSVQTHKQSNVLLVTYPARRQNATFCISCNFQMSRAALHRAHCSSLSCLRLQTYIQWLPDVNLRKVACLSPMQLVKGILTCHHNMKIKVQQRIQENQGCKSE